MTEKLGKIHADEQDLQRLIREREPEANIIISKLTIGVACIYLLVWLLFRIGMFKSHTLLTSIVLLGGVALLLLSAVVSLMRRGRGRWVKYMLGCIMMTSIFGLNLLTGYKTWMLFALPLIISCRYYSISLTVAVNLLSAFLTIACAFCNAYISPLVGYMDLNMVSYTDGTLLDIQRTLYYPVAHSALDSIEILRNTLLLSTFPNLLTLLMITGACAAVIRRSQRMMLEVQTAARQKSDMELELSSNRAKIMLSQIQPHFLYNTLSAIMAIDGNPEETVDAIGEFGKYLRENLNTLTSGDMVSFSKEMQHVMRYLSLERLRFKDKIEIFYDLQASAFSVPALTVQMLVENAVKHGLTQKMQGGVLRIRSVEHEGEYLVVVEDNGAGFDAKETPDGGSHIGLANIRQRLEALCRGYLEIESTPGEGTIAIVHIPKERNC